MSEHPHQPDRTLLNEPVYETGHGPNNELDDVDVVGYVDHVHRQEGQNFIVQIRSDREVSDSTKSQIGEVTPMAQRYNGVDIHWLEVAE